MTYEDKFYRKYWRKPYIPPYEADNPLFIWFHKRLWDFVRISAKSFYRLFVSEPYYGDRFKHIPRFPTVYLNGTIPRYIGSDGGWTGLQPFEIRFASYPPGIDGLKWPVCDESIHYSVHSGRGATDKKVLDAGKCWYEDALEPQLWKWALTFNPMVIYENDRPVWYYDGWVPRAPDAVWKP